MGSLKFHVNTRPAILVAPSLPTPREILYLSNIDDQAGLRIHIPVVQFYDHNPSKMQEDPAKVIREALSKVLVHYYPFAGRLREAPAGKLEVDCTGEGVLFVEADADIALHDFGDLQPPFPCWDKLLHDVPGSQDITGSPLLLIQVTRLRCGGFVLALRWNHCMADADGMVQFMNAVAEMAKGAARPSVPPLWKRELLQPRLKPTVNVPLYEYDQVEGHTVPVAVAEDEMRENPIFFGPREIASLKRKGGSKCTTFEALSACLWRSRTRALNMPADQEVRLIFPLNARSRMEAPLPQGYYGNVIVGACAKTKAGLLSSKPLSFGVELISKAKGMVNDEYVRSVIDLMELNGHQHYTIVGSFLVSDLTKLGFEHVNFGWKNAVYGGAARAVQGVLSFMSPIRKRNGTQGIVVTVCLPSPAMERFEIEMRKAMEHSPSLVT